MCLDRLRLLVIEPRQFAARPPFGMEQLIELGVNRLGRLTEIFSGVFVAKSALNAIGVSRWCLLATQM
jgi:hypothetical protein